MIYDKNKFKDFQMVYLGINFFDFKHSLAHPKKFLCYDFGIYILKPRNAIKSLCKIFEREY